MARRVVITGATGFLGAHALRAITDAGYEPHLLVRDASAGQAMLSVLGGEGSVHAVDLLDSQAVHRVVGAIAPWGALHFAWHDDVETRWTSPENARWTQATLALARALVDAGGQRFVGCGTCAEYDWSHALLSEATPIRPATPYGAAKAAAFDALMQAAPAFGLSVAWGRVFFCYGPGEPTGRLIRDLADKLTRGETADFTDGLQVRDYLHAADIGEAFARLLGSSLEGPVNIASGEGVEVRQLIETAARLLNASDRVRLGALPRRPNDAPRLVADVNRLAQDLGFRPRFNLESGLADTLGVNPGARTG